MNVNKTHKLALLGAFAVALLVPQTVSPMKKTLAIATGATAVFCGLYWLYQEGIRQQKIASDNAKLEIHADIIERKKEIKDLKNQLKDLKKIASCESFNDSKELSEKIIYLQQLIVETMLLQEERTKLLELKKSIAFLDIMNSVNLKLTGKIDPKLEMIPKKYNSVISSIEGIKDTLKHVATLRNTTQGHIKKLSNLKKTEDKKDQDPKKYLDLVEGIFNDTSHVKSYNYWEAFNDKFERKNSFIHFLMGTDKSSPWRPKHLKV